MAYNGTYCKDSDLLIGDVVLKNYDALTTKHIDAAADEIDAAIGAAYATPVDAAGVSRQGWLLLKKIAIYIASGKLLMETDQAGEGTKVHDYALWLLQQAGAALDAISKGDVNLRPTIENANLDSTRGKVLVNNLDGYSQVESFSGWAAPPPPRYLRGAIPYGR
jgi:hypothetical protein